MIMKKYANNSNIHSEDKPKQSRQTSKNKEIESYLSTHYDFRFNTVLGRTEFSPKYANMYSKVSRYDINTFRRELDSEEGIITSADNLYSIIESSFSPRINPIQEYFKALPKADASEVLHKIETSQSVISNLASCVTVRNSEKWLPYLTKWLVAVVANAMDDRECRNHTCLVLTGEQEKCKSCSKNNIITDNSIFHIVVNNSNCLWGVITSTFSCKSKLKTNASTIEWRFSIFPPL